MSQRRNQFLAFFVGAILVFFTVRSIPEVSGAMFGIDLLILVPALAYLGVLSGSLDTTEEIDA